MNNPGGVILVDKPAGPSSARVVSRLKRRLPFDRVGHAGTLDPPATGLLIILCGKASKLQEFFLGEEKAYSGTIRLGITTDTDDTAGNITDDRRTSPESINHAKKTPAELASQAEELKARFSGSQLQLPPQVSALKVDGERAYKAARRGATVELKPREVFVSALDINFVEPDLIRYFVRCSKGYYVRALARDIGAELGVGGCIESLRRVESAPFSIDAARTFDEIDQAADPLVHLIPLEQLPLGLPKIEISSQSFERLCRGDQRPLLEIDASIGQKTASLMVEGLRFGGIIERGNGEEFKIRFLV